MRHDGQDIRNTLIINILYYRAENHVFEMKSRVAQKKCVDCYIDCPDYSVGYLLYGRTALWLGEPPSAS